MSQATPLECLALTTVRRSTGLSEEKVAKGVGIGRKKMSTYETLLAPPSDLLDAMLKVMGCTRALYEVVLSALYRIQHEMPPPAATPVDPTPEDWAEMHAHAIAIGREAELRTLECQAEAVRARKAAEARTEAETLCALVENAPRPWLVVEKVREVQTWAVAERLALRSFDTASDRADRAMELAALAYRVAELAPCVGPFRESLLGITLFYWGNATRAAGDIPAAGALYLEARQLWMAGAAVRGPLAEWRVPVLEGSLHRDQLQFADSLARLDAALAIAPERAKAGILVAKSCTLEQMGDAEQAIAVLEEAEQVVDRQRDSSLYLCLRFNRTTALCGLGRYGKAALALPEVRALADQLGRETVKIRVVWLGARVSTGLGHWADAEAAYKRVLRDFIRLSTVWDCALVSLELAELLCRQKRTKEALALFAEQGVGGEGMAALQQFCEAAESSAVPRELTERVLRLLQEPPGRQEEQPGGNPDLSAFAAAGVGIEPSAALVDQERRDGAVATAAGIDRTAVVRELDAPGGLQETGGRGPDGGHPGDQLIHQAGGRHGVGPAGRQGGRGRGEEDEEDETGDKRTPSDYASKHENAPSGSESRRVLSRPRRSPCPENTGAGSRIARSPEILPEDFAVFVRILMALRDLTQEELATAADISTTTIGSYRKGKSIPFRVRPIVERLAGATKVPLFIVDLYLLPSIAAEREAGGWTQDDVVEPIFQRLRAELQGLVYLLPPLGQRRGEDGPPTHWPPAEVAREEALDLWKRLVDCEDAERWSLVEGWREYQHPGLAELLCHLSEDAASDRADRALELAKLAHRIAELVPGEEAEKRRLHGYTGIFLGNGVRVAGELLPARERFDEGLASWKAGEGSATFLAEWRVLDREASLLREERRFEVALDRLKRALAIAPVESSGRILLNRALTFEQLGDGERALEELRKAEPLIDREREPRLFMILRFNTAAALCLLDEFEEAEGMYPEIQGLAGGRELDGVRLKWLAGRIGAGRGRLDEADAALEEVRQEFDRRRVPWDCSLVTLELATVRLRQGRAADVRILAEELVWVFEAQGIHQEALAALALFREAAERDGATADFTERLVRYLRKAQGDPGLRFSA